MRYCLNCVLACLVIVLLGCAGKATPSQQPTPSAQPPPTGPAATQEPGILATPLSPEALRQAVPALAERDARFAAALSSSQPILLLQGKLDDKQQRAQELAVADSKLQYLARDPLTGQPLRSEIMMVRPALPADLTEATASCADGNCYRVEMFNYSANATVVAIVDLNKGQVLDVAYNPDTQPEIPAYLADLASQIAIHSSEVADALGFKPGVGLAGMPNVKTALNGSACERSHHLCVAPTFLQLDKGKALWAIVDLTDGRLVGIRWTDLGQGEAQPVTEQALQDAVVMAEYCETPHTLSRDGWEMTYVLTPSDGLEIKNVRFQGRPVLDSAKLVDWHVSYSGEDGFGYSDASGCPLFSTASVVAFNGPTVEEIKEGDRTVGFALSQDFRSELWPLPCNYRYVHRFEFYQDGRMWVGGDNLGRGCSNNGTYRPVFRLALAPDVQGNQAAFAQWDGKQWATWPKEGWILQKPDAPTSPEGAHYRVLEGDGQGYDLMTTFGPAGKYPADSDAYVYLSVRKPEEGDSDMVTIGPCCNTDYQQGPEKFVDPSEPVQGQGLVLWYVPRLKNNDQPGQQYCWTETTIDDGIATPHAYPCTTGIMFTPAK
jgi:hypothetical protein